MLLAAVDKLEEEKQSLGCTDEAAWVTDVREWAAIGRLGTEICLSFCSTNIKSL